MRQNKNKVRLLACLYRSFFETLPQNEINMGKLTGRAKERQLLKLYLESEHSEFIAILWATTHRQDISGDRVVGNELDFDMTGVMNGDSAMQLTRLT